MAGSASGLSWDRLARIRLPRQWRGFLTWSVLGLGAVLAVATMTVLGPFSQGAASRMLRLILLLDLVYLIVLLGLVVLRMARLIAARRASAAGSRLHARLVAIFAGLALVPTVVPGVRVAVP